MFILPIIVFALIVVIGLAYGRRLVDTVGNAWLIVTAYTWATVEIFSIFSGWRYGTVLVAWGILCAGLIFTVIRGRLWENISVQLDNRSGVLSRYKELKGYIIFSFVFVIFVSIIALLRSQSMVDNLTHRLPRIMHWIQNQSVAPFATSSSRQIDLSSLTEYMNAQIYILGGNDRMIKLVQAGAYICSAIFIGGICRKLRLPYKFSLLASWLYLLIPAVIIEVITTQTDVVAGTYLLAFIYFLFDYIHESKLRMDRAGFLSCVRLASCVMFGYLAKPTVCFTMVTFFVWMCIVRLNKKDSFLVLMKYAFVGLLTASILFVPSYARNNQAYTVVENNAVAAEMKETVGTVNLPEASTEYVHEEPNQAAVVRNLINPKEFFMTCIQNLGTNASSRCFPTINDLIIRIVSKCGSVLGYTFPYGGGGFWLLVDIVDNIGETSEPSPCIMWFWLAALLFVMTRLSKINKEQRNYFLCVTTGMIIQSGLMGYTYFRQRYLIGVMAALCPAFAIVIYQLKFNIEIKKNIIVGMLAVSSLGAVNALTFEISEVIEGFKGEPIHQYFVDNKEQETCYEQMVRIANDNGYTQVGVMGDIQYEYVLWHTIHNLERLESVNVEDAGLSKYEDKNYIPECIFTESREEIEIGDSLNCHNVNYRCVLSVTDEQWYYTVFVPEK